MSTVSAAKTQASVCPQCGAQFRCGMENGDPECWCASLPALLPLPSKADGEPSAAACFCPACLKLRLASEERQRPHDSDSDTGDCTPTD